MVTGPMMAVSVTQVTPGYPTSAQKEKGVANVCSYSLQEQQYV